MTKQIIPYILVAACIFSACSAEYYNEPDPVTTEGESEMLSLTVSASDIVVSDDPSSRSSEVRGITNFAIGDCVGLIVLDKYENHLVDNVPYKFDGKNWDFDSVAAGEKMRPYYDATMATCIVYYPYKKKSMVARM